MKTIKHFIFQNWVFVVPVIACAFGFFVGVAFAMLLKP